MAAEPARALGRADAPDPGGRTPAPAPVTARVLPPAMATMIRVRTTMSIWRRCASR